MNEYINKDDTDSDNQQGTFEEISEDLKSGDDDSMRM